MDLLKRIRQTSASYARNQELLIAEHKRRSEVNIKISLSPRESEILHSMYEGLSNADIAIKHGLSVNTVKMHIGSIYNKLGSRNKAEVFRIANENKLL